MKRTRFVVIGTGNVGFDLIGKLSKDFDVLCIDNDPAAAERLKALHGEELKLQLGDATSRLVLEEAKVDDAEAVLITTTTEKVNIEVATVLKTHFDPKRVISIGITSKGIKRFEELGVEVLNIFTVSAAGIRNLLEHKTRAAHYIGLGKNEILEVEVHPNSRLANKRLRSLSPLRWKVGIIYREGNILVPRGDTVLKPKDKAVILGEPAVLKTVSDILTFRFEQFPLEFGSTAVVYLSGAEDPGFFQELEYLFSIFPLTRTVLIHSRQAVERSEKSEGLIDRDRLKNAEYRTIDLPLSAAIESVLNESGMECGLIALSRNSLGKGDLGVGKRALLKRLSTAAFCPILIMNGTHPYAKAAVPCLDDDQHQHALETAFEISTSVNNEVTALLVRPSKYIASDADLQEFEARKKSVSGLSLMYRAGVKMPVLEGNPVKAVLGELPSYNLVVADAGGLRSLGRLRSFLNPDVLWHVVRSSPVTTLIVPSVEEAL